MQLENLKTSPAVSCRGCKVQLKQFLISPLGIQNRVEFIRQLRCGVKKDVVTHFDIKVTSTFP